jgi:pimeloyl-ACP methyl ester carboxylesterase
VAARIEVPGLVIHGRKDSLVDPRLSSYLSSVLQKGTLVQLDCASHALMWETCSGEGCVDPHRTVQKLVGDWILIGK